MNTTFDYIGSVVVGGMIVVIVLTLNSNIVTSSFQRNLDLLSQESAVNLTTILETDFKRIGYFANTRPVMLAERKAVRFTGDVNDDGWPDIVTYRLGDPTELRQTKNPSDRPLYRRVDSDSLNVASGLVSFALSYLDSAGRVLPYDSLRYPVFLDRIKMIQIELRIEPTDPVDTTFIPVEIRRVITPKNIGGW
ncbi:MAG: hypothetical protein HBSIN02_18850 [Bacteroidia bacterium]|nr:MAG: hypothetical protein HBSIN02_18850 [Bacteroidia bacterium]